MTLVDDAVALRPDLVALRRELHAHPEVGLDLPSTRDTLLAALDGLGLEVSQGSALTSITAVLRGARPGPTVLLRGDMDGLPVTELTGLPFASTHGTMHACGHDLHMTGLVGAARLLAARRDELPGSVVFMFQPGEEGFAGGRVMLEEGVLDAGPSRPVAAYALHVDSVFPSGAFTTRAGSIMASASGLTIRITGSGGHAAIPHLAIDPIPVAAEVVLALQTFVARRIPAADPAVVSVTRLSSDSAAPNVLATRVEVGVNIRTLSRATFDLVHSRMEELVAGIVAAHGATVEFEWVDSYPVTVNDPAETAAALEVLDDLVGADRVVRMPAPAMASEDFAYVLEAVPGTLVFLGARLPGLTETEAPAMHSETAAFDEDVLTLAAGTLAELAWRRLHRQES